MLPGIIYIHYALIIHLNYDVSVTHKTTSLILQLLGGLLILYSIDSNIGVIKNKSIASLFVNYLHEFPLIKKDMSLSSQGSITEFVSAKIECGRNPKTLDEKLSYLQEQIDTLNRDLEHKISEVNKIIETKANEINVKINKTANVIQRVESKMEDVSIGGVKIQIFGVILMVYGSIAGYIA